MKSQELRDIQAPLKARYRKAADSSVITLKARGTLESESIVRPVPKTRSGKIMRRVLKAIVLDRDPRGRVHDRGRTIHRGRAGSLAGHPG